MVSGTSQYKASDFVSFNQSKNVGVILQVDVQSGTGQDYVRIINDSGALQVIRASEINKKFDLRDLRTKSQAIDSQRNTIYPDNVVKIIAGPFKGRKGVIKYIYRDTIFLWDRDFHQTHGIFVDKTRNIVLLGSEQMNK